MQSDTALRERSSSGTATGQKRRKRATLTPFWFLLPAMTVIVVVLVVPIFVSFFLSFFRFDLNVADFGFKFLGLGNYLYIFQDKLLIDSVKWTAQFTIVAVSLELILGMAFALLLNSPVLGKARGPVRAIFLLPIMVSYVLTAWMWRLMFNASYGPVNHLLSLFGVDKIPWGATAATAGAMVIVTDIWISTPFMMMVLLAGLQNIPVEVLEAAEMDGASAWTKLTQITLPLIKFPIMVVSVIRTMDALRIFDQIYVLTNGGPGNATSTIMFHNYRYAFSYFQIGRAAAMSFAFLLVIMVISYVYTRLLQREAEYL